MKATKDTPSQEEDEDPNVVVDKREGVDEWVSVRAPDILQPLVRREDVIEIRFLHQFASSVKTTTRRKEEDDEDDRIAA